MGMMAREVWNFWQGSSVEKPLPKRATFKLAIILGVVVWLAATADANLRQFNYIQALEQDIELAETGMTITRASFRDHLSDQTRKFQCAGFCNAEVNCTAFSYTTTTGGFVCKFGNVKWNDTKKLSGSRVFFKIPREDYTTILDPFRFKRFDYKATSPADASKFCFSTDGSAVPVGYPSSEALRALRFVIRLFLPKNASFFVGVKLTSVSVNGTWEFRTLRDWPAFVDPVTKDPNQPWAPNEPTKLPYGQPSDIGVMMNSDGEWFTVDTRSATSDATLCMKHTTYEFVNVTGRFHRLSSAVATTWFAADGICKSEGGYHSRAYGQQGIDFISYVRTAKGAADFWLAGTTGAPVATTFWKFPDGLVLDDSLRATDSRQIWEGTNQYAWSNNVYCIREANGRWVGVWCTDITTYICEGGF